LALTVEVAERNGALAVELGANRGRRWGMTNDINIDDGRYDRAKTTMLQLLLSALAEDVTTREDRLIEEMTELLQEDVETIRDVLGVTLRYLAHSTEVISGSAQTARESIAEELATLLKQSGNQ
jgi:hypothetical protein